MNGSFRFMSQFRTFLAFSEAQLRPENTVRDTSLAVTFARTSFMARHPMLIQDLSASELFFPTGMNLLFVCSNHDFGLPCSSQNKASEHISWDCVHQIVASCFILVEADLCNVSAERSTIASFSYSGGTPIYPVTAWHWPVMPAALGSTWPGGRLQFNFGRLALKADKPKRTQSQTEVGMEQIFK